MMRHRNSAFIFGPVMALTLATLPVQAHHGWSGNTVDIELTGTLASPVSLAGPHATMQIVDDEGQTWDITLAPGNRTQRAGLTEDVIPVGAEVTIAGERNSDTSRFEVKTRRVTYDGKDFDVYPPS